METGATPVLRRLFSMTKPKDEKFMKDLTNWTWIKLKGLLFLLIGIIAGVLLLLDNPTWKTVGLLALAIWSFCRFYYFAFYVIEHYVDPNFIFSGLISFARYLIRRWR
jgi:hypothetical protein